VLKKRGSHPNGRVGIVPSLSGRAKCERLGSSGEVAKKVDVERRLMEGVAEKMGTKRGEWESR